MRNFIPQKRFLFKNSLALVCASMFASPAFALSPLPYPLWTVENGKLLDPNGNPFVFRGVTIDHTLAPEKTLQALKDVAALGANSAQIEFPIKPTSGFPRPIAAELREIIKACKDNKLVCVLEANDAAGYYEVEGGLGPDVVAEYWGYYDIREVLNGAQGHIIIAISNQALAPIFGAEAYVDRMRWSIETIRRAYPLFAVMVDSSNWGQDTNKAMHTLAAQNIKSTSTYQNVIYSVEMFDQYVNPETIRDYIASFSSIGAPLVIGGFAPTPYYHPHFVGPLPLNAPRLPAEAVMQYAQQYGAGYFGWSWSGNKNAALDVVTGYTASALTSWGSILFNDSNGIKATAKTASIFSSASSSSVSSSSSSVASSSSSSADANRAPVAAITFFKESSGGCPAFVYGNASASESYDPDGDSLNYQWEVTGNSRTITASGPSVRFSMQPPHYYTIKLTVDDGKGGTASTSIIRNDSSTDNCIGFSSSSILRTSSSSIRSSSSSVPSSVSSSSIRPSSTSASSRSSSSSLAAKAACSYVINSQWGNGFTAAIRIKNTSAQTINGWSVNWQYSDGSKITGSWNATLVGANPYSATNLSWNASIQPGQTVEFGFQGSKTAGTVSAPVVTGSVCQ